MSKSYSKDEKLSFLNEAIADYEEAQKLVEHASKLLSKCGVRMCGGSDGIFGGASSNEYNAEKSLHVYSGILKLQKILDQKAVHPYDCMGVQQNNRKAVFHNGVMFFQLGDVESAATKYHYR